jgi:hypothetical protein
MVIFFKRLILLVVLPQLSAVNWEPSHGKFFKHYPWEMYDDITDYLRYTLYDVIALDLCLRANIQAPKSLRDIFAPVSKSLPRFSFNFLSFCICLMYLHLSRFHHFVGMLIFRTSLKTQLMYRSSPQLHQSVQPYFAL